MARRPRSVLVTGFPGRQLPTHLIRELAVQGDLSVSCLVAEGRQDQAKSLLAALPPPARERVSLWLGDPKSMDLGLSGEEFNALAQSVDVIHHCASITDPAATQRDL